MKNVLIVSPFFPLPANFGGSKDVWNRILSLSKQGYRIDLLYTEEFENKNIDLQIELAKYVENVFFVKRLSGVKLMFSFLPYQVKSRYLLSDTIIKDILYDYTILEGDYVGEVLLNVNISFGKKILRVHNNEGIYFLNLFKSVFPAINSLYYLTEAVKFWMYSRMFYSKFNNFLFISETERQKYKYTNNSISLLTDFPKEHFCEFNSIDSHNILFVGSLFMPNNIEAIKWYLDNVHDDVINLHKHSTFTIVGSSKGKNLEYLKKMVKDKTNVFLFTDVPNVRTFYENATVVINTMFNGAGVKVKSLEAIINGVPLVSTFEGIEGIGLTNNKEVIIANDKNTFLLAIDDLLVNKEKRRMLVTNAQKFMRSQSHEALLPNFFKNII